MGLCGSATGSVSQTHGLARPANNVALESQVGESVRLDSRISCLLGEIECFVVAGTGNVMTASVEREPAGGHVRATGRPQQASLNGNAVGALFQHPVAIADKSGSSLPQALAAVLVAEPPYPHSGLKQTVSVRNTDLADSPRWVANPPDTDQRGSGHAPAHKSASLHGIKRYCGADALEAFSTSDLHQLAASVQGSVHGLGDFDGTGPYPLFNLAQIAGVKMRDGRQSPI
jgi:hypothetical protein